MELPQSSEAATQHQREIDKPLCNCGVVGIFNNPRASVMTYYALHALQHRGQEAAGIVASRPSQSRPGKRTFTIHKDHGLVLDVFNEDILVKDLRGDCSIGHNRYSTTGNNIKRANIQPFFVNYHHGNLALAHNGNLTNTLTLRRNLSNDGVLFQTTTDSEIMLHLIARSREDSTIGRIRDALRQVRGAYSVTILTDDALVAARDPHGFRPLCIGKLGDTYIVASETCALDILSAEYVRDVRPNEIVVIDAETVKTGHIHSYQIDDVTPRPAHCIFEYIYFSRPDSHIFGHSVDKVRRKLGKRLAEESGMISDRPGGKVVVINVPDSSNTATLGFRQVNEDLYDQDTRYEIGLIRNHYVGRTFIAPGQSNRELKVKMKFNVVRGVLEGQQVVVVDDSIVRGTTSKALVNLVKEAAPRSVHLRISSPPITHPCKYGMDFPSKEELIANNFNLNVSAIRDSLGVESLHYLSIEGLLDSVPHENGEGYCTACFTGNYPVEIDSEASKLALEEIG
ncbi:MAG: amidophosphoribosyltransferase [Chlorobi bacterium]|nr:MAG: glutamine phosphoribosylpyrophosphate amidotransferase [Chlorobi bacterium OLB7]MBK8912427.1 amidophosphoribosyltransferase [Chlorobiota bacterium]MBX7218098.1 amidophosphoribosyltransferase [Candidatus Kapabacteria bacterium]